MNRMESFNSKPSLFQRVRAHQIIVHGHGLYDTITLRSGCGENDIKIELDRNVTLKEKKLFELHNNATGKGRQKRTNDQLPKVLKISHD